jgi:hypothetical protein
MSIALGLIVSPLDFTIVPRWLEYHAVYFDRVIIAVDGEPADVSALIKMFKYFPEYKIQIFSHKLNNDFAGMRNAVVEQNTCDWLVFLDADEELLCAAHIKDEIQTAESGGKKYIAFPRVNFIQGVERKDLYPDYQFRGSIKGSKYQNMAPSSGAVPGCHETLLDIASDTVYISELQILHTKGEFRFRHKGYSDENSKEEDKILTEKLKANNKNA